MLMSVHRGISVLTEFVLSQTQEHQHDDLQLFMLMFLFRSHRRGMHC